MKDRKDTTSRLNQTDIGLFRKEAKGKACGTLKTSGLFTGDIRTAGTYSINVAQQKTYSDTFMQ